MKISKSMLLLAALLLTVNIAGAKSSAKPLAKSAAKSARQTPPDAVVAELYRQSARKRSPFFQTRRRALVNQYFEKELGDLIWKDAIRSKGEVGAIDGDPLFNAQDMEIKHFVIHKPEFAKGMSGKSPASVGAEVKVTFENFGAKKEILFVLRRSTGLWGWKISNIKYDDGADLLGILKSGN
jgi:hypothetical protein